MNKQLLSVLFLFISSTIIAQNKNFTMQEAVLGLSSTLAVKNLKQLKWMGSSEKYAQAISTENFKGFVRTDPKTSITDTIFSLDELNKTSAIKLTTLPAIEWIDENAFVVSVNNTYFISKKNSNPI